MGSEFSACACSPQNIVGDGLGVFSTGLIPEVRVISDDISKFLDKTTTFHQCSDVTCFFVRVQMERCGASEECHQNPHEHRSLRNDNKSLTIKFAKLPEFHRHGISQ